MAVFILPTEQAERKPQPDLARGDALPAPKQRKCLGCGKPWISGHSCMTPPTPPTTDTRVHEAGVTRFGTFDGQRVYPVTFLCGCQRVGCAQSAEAEAAEVAWAAARPCSSCRFRAGRSALDEEMVRA